MVSPELVRPPVVDPVQVLMTDTDPERRSCAHVALGQRALARKDLGTAEVHLREAVALDPGEATRELSTALERARHGRRRRWFR